MASQRNTNNIQTPYPQVLMMGAVGGGGALLWDLALSLTHSPRNSEGGNITPILEGELGPDR